MRSSSMLPLHIWCGSKIERWEAIAVTRDSAKERARSEASASKASTEWEGIGACYQDVAQGRDPLAGREKEKGVKREKGE